MKKAISGLVAVLFVFSLFPAVWAANENSAFVNVAKVFDEYKKTQDHDQVLQEKGRKKEEEREAIVREVKQMKDELSLVSDDAKASKEQALENKIRELQDFERDAKRDLGKERNEVVKEIFSDIDAVVKSYGERKGLDYIFNDRALVFQNNKFDITKEVLDELNKNYSKKKK